MKNQKNMFTRKPEALISHSFLLAALIALLLKLPIALALRSRYPG